MSGTIYGKSNILFSVNDYNNDTIDSLQGYNVSLKIKYLKSNVEKEVFKIFFHLVYTKYR